MTSKAATAAVYTRISKHNSRVPKVADQEVLCREIAKQCNYEIIKVYEDDGISASKGLNRPGWNEMLADVAEGKFEILMAQSDDRFTRQPMEKELLLLASIKGGVRWHTANEGRIDPATADGMMRSGLSTLMARTETMRKAERQRQANDAVRAKGQPLRGGDRPFGYEADKVTLRKPESDLIEQAYADFVSGKRVLSEIRTAWNKAGILTTRGKPWDIAKVEKMLRRPRNIRLVLSRGVLLKLESGEYQRGEWEAIVDDDTYNAALVRLNDPKRRLTKAHEQKHLLTSLATCGSCGTVLRAAFRNKEQVYRCGVHDQIGVDKLGVSHVSIRTGVLDPLVTKAVVSAILMAPGDGISDPDTTTLNALHIQIERLRKEAARLVEAVRKGAIDLDDIAADRRQIKTDMLAAEHQITDIAQRNAQAALMSEARRSLFSTSTINLSKAAEVKAEIRERFDALDLQQKRSLVQGMVRVTVENGRKADRVKIQHLVATSLNEDAD